MPRAKLKQRADGRYQCKYQGRVFYGLTPKEAQQKRDEYRRLIESGLKREAAGLTVFDYAMRWVSIYKAHVSDATYNQYVRILNRFCDFEGLGSLRMADITTQDIQRFYNAASNMSQSYISVMRTTIGGLFRFATADRVTLSDPTVKARAPKGTKGTHRAITPLERNLIDRTQHRLRPAVMIMLYAGLRRGEVLGINIDRDIDFINRTITVREAITFDNQGLPNRGGTKTEAGMRIVPMVQKLADELTGLHGQLLAKEDGSLMSQIAWDRAWEAYLRALNVVHNGCQKRWYGKTRDHKARIAKYNELIAAGRLIEAEQVKLPPWEEIEIRPHDLRHTYCTMLYDGGIDVKTAQKWMGHADPSVTMEIYTHLTAEREKSAVYTLENALKNQIGCQNGCQNVQTGLKTLVK